MENKVIRQATKQDAGQIRLLLQTLGYTITEGLYEEKLTTLLTDPSHQLLVHECEGALDGFLSVVTVSHIALDHGLALVSYFALEGTGENTGKVLQNFSVELAMQKGCSWVQVYGLVRKTQYRWLYNRTYNRLTVCNMKRVGNGNSNNSCSVDGTFN
ncbi:MAG: hypothetical protein JSU01_01815 [Bacteroidetes bacterium]|nr:hypothetical protein [Bacteroidota bacterium]